MLAYREGRHQVSGPALVERLREAWASSASLTTALLLAGELECGVADLYGDGERTRLAAEITNLAARAYIRQDPSEGQRIRVLIETLQVPNDLRVSAPEGFAYYALHPQSYAQLASSLGIAAAAVIGIRSIGTTLSAVVRESLRARGVHAERITVRPQGHPFDRKTKFSNQQREWMKAHSLRSEFLVVDEGPGLSGSSLLSVAEALLKEGIAADRIHFLCGHMPDLNRLCARDAATRWRRFQCHSVDCSGVAHSQGVWIGAGEWRQYFLLAPDSERWPAVWKNVERAKYLTHDHTRLIKFEGFGHYGEAVVARSRLLADAAFASAVEDFNSNTGFAQYEFVPGRIAALSEVSEALLRRMAEYLAARAQLFPVAAAPSDELAIMARVNAQKAFGIELDLDTDFLTVVRPVVTDNRMAPHKWLFADDGRILKLDSAAHGDDHFFPGPCDVAWDLAGAIVEWGLGRQASDFLLAEYRRASGDDACGRLADYLLAYALSRLGCCMMAADSMHGTEEQCRFERARDSYRAKAAVLIATRQEGRIPAQISG